MVINHGGSEVCNTYCDTRGHLSLRGPMIITPVAKLLAVELGSNANADQTHSSWSRTLHKFSDRYLEWIHAKFKEKIYQIYLYYTFFLSKLYALEFSIKSIRRTPSSLRIAQLANTFRELVNVACLSLFS